MVYLAGFGRVAGVEEQFRGQGSCYQSCEHAEGDMGDGKPVPGVGKRKVVVVVPVDVVHCERNVHGGNGNGESSQKRKETDGCTTHSSCDALVPAQDSEADPDNAKDRPWKNCLGDEVEDVGDGADDIVHQHDSRKGVMEDVVRNRESLAAVVKLISSSLVGCAG